MILVTYVSIFELSSLIVGCEVMIQCPRCDRVEAEMKYGEAPMDNFEKNKFYFGELTDKLFVLLNKIK